jgi:ParB/RepB/Spo0J family partition protein
MNTTVKPSAVKPSTTKPSAVVPNFDLDLPSLDAFNAKPVKQGERFFAPLDRFEEDPNNPRTEQDAIDSPEWVAFVADIAQHGILQPVVVREVGERFVICFGARRFRAATQLQLKEIPYVLTDAKAINAYAQVSENEQRKNLQPHELAAFIAGRIAVGDKRAEIAKQLGIDAQQLSRVLSFNGAPPYLLSIYHSGKLRSPEVFAKLRAEFERRTPDEQSMLQAQCDAAPTLSRSVVEALLASSVETDAESQREAPAQPVSALVAHGKSIAATATTTAHSLNARTLARSAVSKASKSGALTLNLQGVYPVSINNTPLKVVVSAAGVSLLTAGNVSIPLSRHKVVSIPAAQ